MNNCETQNPCARVEELIQLVEQAKNTPQWQLCMTGATQPDVFQKLIQGVGYCVGMGVEGDIAEFGTMTGRTAVVIAQALSFFTSIYGASEQLHHIAPRKLHLFDSFKGLPKVANQVDSSSPHVTSGVWGEGTCKGLTKDQLLGFCSRLYPQDRICIYDGWFKDTLPLVDKETKFAMVHVDCDLYESTIQVLDYYFSNDLFADGCALFFDDWNCNRASPKFGERRAWAECLDKYDIVFSDCGEYGIAGHKFIIHK
jgi:hypothetical protein